MPLPSSNRNSRSARPEVDGCGWGRGLVRSGASSVAQLSVAIQTPAFQVTIVENGTGVIQSKRELVVRIRKGGIRASAS